MLLEGASGIGKSVVILSLKPILSSTLSEKEEIQSKPNHFFHITLSDFTKMEAVLQHAFQEGTLVILDEINTAPVKALLNTYMSGVNLQGNPPQHPGFFIICATQNPPLFAHRQQLAPALENRFHKIIVKDYHNNDLLNILYKKKIAPAVAHKAFQKYQEAKSAINNPALKPTPRDLLRTADQIQKNRSGSSSHPTPSFMRHPLQKPLSAD